jgi:PAS domain S-box-containing protein
VRELMALLVHENRRYAELFEYSPDAYLVTDAGGSIREANRAALELLRSPREHLIGRALSECVAPADRAQLASCTPPASRRARLVGAQGAEVDCEVSVRSIPLRKGGAGGLCWLLRAA